MFPALLLPMTEGRLNQGAVCGDSEGEATRLAAEAALEKPQRPSQRRRES